MKINKVLFNLYKLFEFHSLFFIVKKFISSVLIGIKFNSNHSKNLFIKHYCKIINRKNRRESIDKKEKTVN